MLRIVLKLCFINPRNYITFQRRIVKILGINKNIPLSWNVFKSYFVRSPKFYIQLFIHRISAEISWLLL